MNTETLAGLGGINIFIRSWLPAQAPRGVVVIVHGFNSHSGYYTWVGEQLASKGLAVYALDLRGRGKSEGERYYVGRFAEYVDDVARSAALARLRHPASPLFVLGHSAGGVVSCLYALEHEPQLAGFICESFAYHVPAPAFALVALRGLSYLVPHAHVLQLKNEHFSRDPKVVAAMDRDPLIAGESQATQTVAEMARADEWLKQELPRISLPLLILHGTSDEATKPSGSQEFYDLAGSSDKTLKLYEGHVHDLLNDLGKEAVLDDIQAWIEARLTPTA